MKKRYLLVGNYGVGNLGDEALKEYFLTAYPELEWKVVSAKPSPGEFHRFPLGVQSFCTPWWRTVSALRNSDGMVFGGGSLFTDSESVFACILWGWHAALARLFHKPVFLAFQGIGPFRTKTGERIARWVCSQSSFVSVRDSLSIKRSEAWRLPSELNKKFILSFDPVYKQMHLISSKKSPSNESKKLLVIIPRKNSPEHFRYRTAHLHNTQEWDEVIVLSLQPEHPDEKALYVRLAQTYGADVKIVTTLEELLSAVSEASFVLAQRYHGAVSALACNVPFEVVPQREGDKLDAIPEDNSELLQRVSTGESALRAALSS